jgi:hypothetical protein
MPDRPNTTLTQNRERSTSFENLDWLTCRIEQALARRDFDQAVQCVGLLNAVVERCREEYARNPDNAVGEFAADIGKRLDSCSVQLKDERNNLARRLLKLRRGKRMVRQTTRVVPIIRANVRIDRTG